MSYFNKFPQVAIDVKGDTDLVMLTDITRKVRFSDLAKQNYIQYDFYDVVAGETPEYVASEFYGDPKLHLAETQVPQWLRYHYSQPRETRKICQV